MRVTKLLFLLLMLLFSNIAYSQRQFALDLWEKKPAEKSKDTADTARVYVFLPETADAMRRAVLVLPGGAYEHLAIEHEGTDWAPFFNSMGIACVVLKYRMPHGKKEVPISDAEQAMRLIREHATEWKINPNDVGVMGFSAGGHLASTLATHAKKGACPNFQILFYPVVTMDPEFTHKGSHDNFLGKKPSKKDEAMYSNEKCVIETTPRAIIILSSDDDIVVPSNGINYQKALHTHNVPTSLMIYPTGGHGWGMNIDFPYHAEMLMNLRSWLNSF